jgi:hypothetical protein
MTPTVAPHAIAYVAEEEMDHAFEAQDYAKGLQVLKVFGQIDKKVAFAGCDVIWELATSEFEATKLGNAGACEVVVDVLRSWGKADRGMAWNGCSAIANLAFRNEVNSAKLGAAGACEVVADVLRAWGMTDMDVAFYGCRAISCLAKQKFNNIKLEKLGALSVVMATLQNDFSKEAAEEF